jgi:poly-gamma-glutamate synthase PgsB/CapB
MGPTEADVARALAGMIPVKGVLITAEQRHLELLGAAARDRGTRLLTISEKDLGEVTEDFMSRFSYIEHRENVALALRVLDELGVPREVAMDGMWKATPDPGALTVYEVDFFGRRIHFVNGFAANDPHSTETVWSLARHHHREVERTVAVFNLRGDRPGRTIQLARDAAFWRDADRVVLMGDGAYLFARMASKAGVGPGRLVYAGGRTAEEIFEIIVGLCRRSTLVIGMANIGGQGLGLVRLFRNRSVLPNQTREQEAH